MANVQQVCDDCGRTASYLTGWKKFSMPPRSIKSSMSTYHDGLCDFCGREKPVTETRDFYYPDFALLAKAVGKRYE